MLEPVPHHLAHLALSVKKKENSFARSLNYNRPLQSMRKCSHGWVSLLSLSPAAVRTWAASGFLELGLKL